LHFPVFDTTFFVLLLIVAVSGTVRGFAGFGAGMVFMPVAAALIGPKIAAVIIWLVDALPTIPILVPALARVRWKTVLPVLLGYALAMPLGIWWLVAGNVELLRWAISLAVLAAVTVLWSGWRYSGERSPFIAAGVGICSGVFGGATQLSGPPVVIYWLSGDAPAWQFRANIIVLFFLTTILSGSGMALSGIFTLQAATYAVVFTPVYAIGVYAGQRLFAYASEEFFRRLAFCVILFAALSGLPLFDALLHRG
jgi:uncharacterized membrane protein YfcA